MQILHKRCYAAFAESWPFLALGNGVADEPESRNVEIRKAGISPE
jgi:hypothetical protein